MPRFSSLCDCRGLYDIFVSREGQSRCVGRYDNRGSFGELALMYNTPRAATIVATTEGSLWGLVSFSFLGWRCSNLFALYNSRHIYKSLLFHFTQQHVILPIADLSGLVISLFSFSKSTRIGYIRLVESLPILPNCRVVGKGLYQTMVIFPRNQLLVLEAPGSQFFMKSFSSSNSLLPPHIR